MKIRRRCAPVVSQQIFVAEGCVFHLRRYAMTISRSPEGAKGGSFRSAQASCLGGIRLLQAAILGGLKAHLCLHSTARLSMKSNTIPITHVQSREGQYLGDLDHVADEDATVVFVGIATDNPWAIEHTWNTCLPKMARIIGGIGIGQDGADGFRRLSRH